MVNISWKPLLLDDVCWGLSGFNMFQWRNAIWSVVFPVSSLARQISSCGNGGALENIVMGPIVYCHLRSLRATERSPVASIDWGFLKWEYHGVPKTIRCQYSNGLTLDDLGNRFRNPPRSQLTLTYFDTGWKLKGSWNHRSFAGSGHLNRIGGWSLLEVFQKISDVGSNELCFIYGTEGFAACGGPSLARFNECCKAFRNKTAATWMSILYSYQVFSC